MDARGATPPIMGMPPSRSTSPMPYVLPCEAKPGLVTIVDIVNGIVNMYFSEASSSSSSPSSERAKVMIKVNSKNVRFGQPPQSLMAFVDAQKIRFREERCERAIEIKVTKKSGEKERYYTNPNRKDNCCGDGYLAFTEAPTMSSASTLGAKVQNFLTIPMEQLGQWADGLNKEGATIGQYFKDRIYANLCLVIDTPFHTEPRELKNITEEKNRARFKLKESVELTYNEPRASLVYALMLHYYITHAHEITQQKGVGLVRVMVFVHRNSTGPEVVKHLVDLLSICYPELQKKECPLERICKFERCRYHFTEYKVEIGFYSGEFSDLQQTDWKSNYNNVDIFLTFSMISGLIKEWPSGSLVIPSKWTPFPLIQKQKEISFDESYSVDNHLLKALPEIIGSQTTDVVKIINERFPSPNESKKEMKATILTQGDFHQKSHLLQVDDTFNPSDLKEQTVVIKQSGSLIKTNGESTRGISLAS